MIECRICHQPLRGKKAIEADRCSNREVCHSRAMGPRPVSGVTLLQAAAEGGRFGLGRWRKDFVVWLRSRRRLPSWWVPPSAGRGQPTITDAIRYVYEREVTGARTEG